MHWIFFGLAWIFAAMVLAMALLIGAIWLAVKLSKRAAEPEYLSLTQTNGAATTPAMPLFTGHASEFGPALFSRVQTASHRLRRLNHTINAVTAWRRADIDAGFAAACDEERAWPVLGMLSAAVGRCHFEACHALKVADMAEIASTSMPPEVAAAWRGAVQADRSAHPADWSQHRPMLWGSPCTIKECFAMAGENCGQSAFLARADSRGLHNAPAVARLRAAGAIPIAHTSMSEGGMWYESVSVLFGRTRNPYHPGRGVGGSSGGEAACIATGVVPFGLGSDVGGSLRIPACFCGIWAHKPSGGTVPAAGQFPAMVTPMLTPGPMARHAAYLWPLYTVLAGPVRGKLPRNWFSADIEAPTPRPRKYKDAQDATDWLWDSFLEKHQQYAGERTWDSIHPALGASDAPVGLQPAHGRGPCRMTLEQALAARLLGAEAAPVPESPHLTPFVEHAVSTRSDWSAEEAAASLQFDTPTEPVRNEGDDACVNAFGIDTPPLPAASCPPHTDAVDCDRALGSVPNIARVLRSKLRIFTVKDLAASRHVHPLGPAPEPAVLDAIARVKSCLVNGVGVPEQRVTEIELPELRQAFDIWSATLEMEHGPPFRYLLEHQGTQPIYSLFWEFLKSLAGYGRFTAPAVGLAIIEPLVEKFDPGHTKRLVELGNQLRIRLNELLGDDGVLVLPVHPVTAPPHNVPYVQFFGTGYTSLINAMALPATAVPCGLDEHGVPVGVQVVGAWGSDALTMSIATVLEHYGSAQPRVARCPCAHEVGEAAEVSSESSSGSEWNIGWVQPALSARLLAGMSLGEGLEGEQEELAGRASQRSRARSLSEASSISYADNDAAQAAHAARKRAGARGANARRHATPQAAAQ